MELQRRKNKNWNIFAGDIEYRTNFFLQFLSPFTTIRYERDRFQRMLFQSRAFIFSSALLWGFTYLRFGGFSFLVFMLGLMGLSFSYYFLSIRFTPWHVRGCYLFAEFFLQVALHLRTTPENWLLLTSFLSFPTLVSDILLVISWDKHLGISLGLLILRLLWTWKMSVTILGEVFVILVMTLLLAYIEKLMKEDWVLYDSFKKAQNMALKLTDSNPFPVFVIDSMGRIIKENERAKCLSISKENRESKEKMKSFLKIVHPNHQDLITQTIKRVAKERKEELFILLETSAEDKKEETKNIEHESRYESFRLILERFAWKSTNCIMITCESIMQSKLAHEIVLQNEISIKKQLAALQDKLEKEMKSAEDKSTFSELLYNTMQISSHNEQSIVATKQFISDFQPEVENLHIEQYLRWFMEMQNVKAHPKGIVLNLTTEACFPKEVSGEKKKFEIVLSALLSYIIENTENGEQITLQATLKHPNNDGFLLTFGLLAPLSANLNVKIVELSIGPPHFGKGLTQAKRKLVEKYGLPLVQCRSIIDWLKGSIEIAEVPQNKLGIYLDIPFNNVDDTKTMTIHSSPGLFELEQVSKYSTKWGKPNKPEKIEPPLEIKKEVEEIKEADVELQKSIAEAAKDKIKEVASKAKDRSKEEILAKIRRKAVITFSFITRQGWKKCVSSIDNDDDQFRCARSMSPPMEKIVEQIQIPELILQKSEEKVVEKPPSKSIFTTPKKEKEDNLSMDIDEASESGAPRNDGTPVSRVGNDRYFGDSEVRMASRKSRKKSDCGEDNKSAYQSKIYSQPESDSEKTRVPLIKTVSKLYQGKISGTYLKRKWMKTSKELKEEEKKINEPKVLIVEDNDFNIVPIKSTLKRNKIEFDIAKNGLMAVERYERTMTDSEQYGVILMDLEMPMMNGYEATEEIRKIEKKKKHQRTFICGLSAYTDKKVEQRCLRCGMDQYISKPINMENMLNMIRQQFENAMKGSPKTRLN